MLLFHGSRAYFTRFDFRFIGTGEGAGSKIGMHFVTSLKGAAAHAERYVRGESESLVYVCKLKPGAVIVDVTIPLYEQSDELVALWSNLPFSASVLLEAQDWFAQLLKPLYSQHGSFQPPVDCEQRFSYLKSIGVDAICNAEFRGEDNYLHGTTWLLLNPDAIGIVEVHPSEALHWEAVGPAKEYVLADTAEPLGETGVMSRLRRKDLCDAV